ncbi:UbiA family prenyltransferase [Streptomyces sp. Go-475]|uniref:UbiA family prenyltransferase n=1 Tax=Streptomyces sp. Go-475 TaxID=2072505 RepID=UPI000DEEBBFD|nr:UbiA family prenyltransferase [Streptomyces sp. Go-475]AXE88763.1 1,4-dihydroxy-2-naphthoate octaprenyltransferase [Streptomyces sp. Go-475]
MAVKTAVPTEAPGRSKLGAYARLGKLSFFDFYLCVPLVWTALPGALLWQASTWLTLTLFLAGQVGVVAATVAFDDLTGVRDGSDARNYTPETGALRDLSRKPLLSGVLTVREATRFAWGAAAWGVALWTVTAATAPHQPLWACVALLYVALSSMQYSYGLKLSYRGGQELLLVSSSGLVVLLPYALVSGRVTGLVVLESVLFGLWSILVSLYSNMNDIAGDRFAGRRNLATMTGPRAYRSIIAALTLVEPGAVVAAVVLDVVPAWFLAILTPLFLARAVQVYKGVVRGEALAARVLGIKCQRLGVVLLLAGNLLAVHVAR